ncbi:probable protein phosphatase 2C 12 [Oryza brachyantha]|uniref:protein-serine/threonine phosphatase n=1 Tax=Oryza brachyantha TaxID=4533 RepID=J3LPH9_ORYBR|nr:probable protein phosphatase 2C 12 [Oryza brachyantha]
MEVQGEVDGSGVPLAVLLKRELCNQKVEKPDILFGEANKSKKGEDFTFVVPRCHRRPAPAEGDAEGTGAAAGASGDDDTISVFAIFDGHNGSAAAIYTRENLLNNVLAAIPPNLTSEEWTTALPRALVAGFVKTDKEFQTRAARSGTTVTFVIIDGWVVTVASVGDSRCILESAEGTVYFLSADHRLDSNEEEVERITASGGDVGRINIAGGAGIGPLRCWPGGLCLSRSIGDIDVGEFIVPVPHVKQVKLSNAGGRLVIASDGVWDALRFQEALNYTRGLPAEAAASRIVKESVSSKGLRDDTTCIVIDILPPEKLSPPLKKHGKGVIKALFHRRPSDELAEDQMDRGCLEPDVVEEIYEEGSAMLAQRLKINYPAGNMFKLHDCAVCQLEMKPGEGISVHGNVPRHSRVDPWGGPFLCSSCQLKKEAMEGKQHLTNSQSAVQPVLK